jgi:hypothetical protein
MIMDSVMDKLYREYNLGTILYWPSYELLIFLSHFWKEQLISILNILE